MRPFWSGAPSDGVLHIMLRKRSDPRICVRACNRTRVEFLADLVCIAVRPRCKKCASQRQRLNPRDPTREPTVMERAAVRRAVPDVLGQGEVPLDEWGS